MRYWFGGTPADWTFSVAPGSDTPLLTGGVIVTFWTDQVGGVQHTDLLDDSGQPITSVISGDGLTAPKGTIPRFQGPPDVTGMWADAGAGERFWMPATNFGDALDAHLGADDPHGTLAAARAYTDDAIARLPPPGGGTGVPGVVALESFSGATWDDKFSAALSYAAAQTYRPVIALPNGGIELSRGPYTLFDGLRLTGPLGAPEREFATRGPQCVVTVSKAPLFAMPTSVRSISMQNIQYRASGSVDWMVRETDFANGPIMSDAVFYDVGWVGFSSIMHTRHLRVSIQRMYANNGTDVQFKLGGSDNSYWLDGGSYLSGSLPPTAPAYVYFTSMSRTRVGPLYLTPQYATGFRIEGGLGGLSFDGTLLDCTGRDANTACQGSAIYIHSGQGHVFRNLWFFNTATNPAATGRAGERGHVYIKAAAKEIAFIGCQWSGGVKQTTYTPTGTPAIYCEAGVTDVQVHAPLAPNSGEKILQQAAAGALACDNPSWTITTAP
ncbi:hypothetical protein ABZ801_00985 [Actinomadura sp. NPDC047616]|uniref:hypothetical protein n=1 Tax=Actinomadura sp. NPDC047616 TaxID=3155914 RepID=UPI0033CFD50B